MARYTTFGKWTCHVVVAWSITGFFTQGQAEITNLDTFSIESNASELIQERFPNGKIRIERRVVQDADGNYVKDGAWKMFDQQGTAIAEGNFRNNKREGTWRRWLQAESVQSSYSFSTVFSQFSAPFISEATFRNGQINGLWTISDGKDRKVLEIEFSNGQRDGKATWWFSNGHKKLQVTYRNGVIDGQRVEWNSESKLISKQTFQNGRKLAKKTFREYPENKSGEGVFLHAKEVVRTLDNFWNTQFATYTIQGIDKKHGHWISWHSNGKRKYEGEFKNNLQVGSFTWWFSNGQKSTEGSFIAGKRQGAWTWWHQNGQKATNGSYADGNPTGNWKWWDHTGKLASRANFSLSEESITSTEKKIVLQPEHEALLPLEFGQEESESILQR